MKLRAPSLMSVIALMSACATTTPAHLLEVREAYARSLQGAAGMVVPMELNEARRSLDLANTEFDDHGDTPACRELVYTARSKVAMADTKARREIARLKVVAGIATGVVARDVEAKVSEAALAASRDQLQDANRESDIAAHEARVANNVATHELVTAGEAQDKVLQYTTAQLEAEKQARVSAEFWLGGVLKDLATIAEVTDENRGVVITFSADVLFAPGTYVVRDSAMAKLDRVAEALKALAADKLMVVEGHTDNRSLEMLNQPLSTHRAAAVRDYLVLRGVDAPKITAIGLGSTRPLFNNATADNRADNRRVEIIIGVEKLSAR